MSSSEEDGWSDIESDEQSPCEHLCQCLFCEVTYSKTEEIISHFKDEHQFNLIEFVKSKNIDFYTYIKLINYTRTQKPTPSDVKELNFDLLNDDGLYKPVLEDDMLLQIDLDDIMRAVDNQDEELDLKKRLKIAEDRAAKAEEFLQRTVKDLESCRKELSTMLLTTSQVDNNVEPKESTIINSNEDDDTGYFGSYGHYGIHEEMLKDTVRTHAYRDFIFNNPKIFCNARVLDVGCGTSVLSLFAAKAGAAHVTGVDFSEVAYNAMDVVRENRMDQVVDIMKGRAEELKLTDKVDVIVSEWMGYFLLFESMLDTVLYCRDNYLKPGGCIYPNKCSVKVAGLDDTGLYASKIGYWSNVYGLKMTSMRKMVLEEALVEVVPPTSVMTAPAMLVQFDLMTVTVDELQFDRGFTLTCDRDANLSAIVGYFDVLFEGEHPIEMCSSPLKPPTHWKQTVFFLKRCIPLKKGQTVLGRLICKKNKKDLRALDIAIFIYEQNEKDILLRQHFVMS